MASPDYPHPNPNLERTTAPSERPDTGKTGASTTSPPSAGSVFGTPAEPGEIGTLGPYRLVRVLGRGGMGVVYAALDTRLHRRLALKVMLPESAADWSIRERFVREAQAAAKITHDNVVTVYEADQHGGLPYIAMQYLEGYPLDAYLKKKGNPTVGQVLRIGRETAAGLAAAHRLGLVHRDIKPANLWLEAPQGRVKVLDFGLARPVDAEVELTQSGAIVGTPAYMSPEQARGEKVDHRTDLFSLGAVLFRLCTGRPPFQGASVMAVLIALGTENPPPVRDLNPAVPEPLADLIHELLAKNPDGRPKSADTVAIRLRAMAQPAPATGQAPEPRPAYVPLQVTAVPDADPFAELDATEADSAYGAEEEQRRPRRALWWAATGVVALIASVFGGVIILHNRDGAVKRTDVPDGAVVKDKSGAARGEPDELKKGGAAASVAAGPFQINSVWVTDTPKRVLTVTERKGDTFKARFVKGDEYDREVNGEIKGSRLSWYAKDVRIIKGDNPGGDHHGTIIAEKDTGFKIDIVHGLGKVSGTFTLRLKSEKQ